MSGVGVRILQRVLSERLRSCTISMLLVAVR